MQGFEFAGGGGGEPMAMGKAGGLADSRIGGRDIRQVGLYDIRFMWSQELIMSESGSPTPTPK